MLVINELKILIFLSFLSFLNDISSSKKKYYEKCISNINFHIVLLLHHFISVFTILGWLSSNKYILIFYVFTVVTIFVHCFIHKKCLLTKYIQKNCKNKVPFRDLYYFLKLKNEMGYIIGCFFIITMIRLQSNIQNFDFN